jgi:REP element-mobilizing transposase RayT
MVAIHSMNIPVWFLTWTAWGTWLPGDSRGWKHRKQGNRTARVALANWHHARLSHSPCQFNPQHRTVIANALIEHAQFRCWNVYLLTVRSNHVHILLAANCDAQIVRDSLKARATRMLRIAFPQFTDRPVWTRGGDVETVDDEVAFQGIRRYILQHDGPEDVFVDVPWARGLFAH